MGIQWVLKLFNLGGKRVVKRNLTTYVREESSLDRRKLLARVPITYTIPPSTGASTGWLHTLLLNLKI